MFSSELFPNNQVGETGKGDGMPVVPIFMQVTETKLFS
jgi:hypothetical protein